MRSAVIVISFLLAATLGLNAQDSAALSRMQMLPRLRRPKTDPLAPALTRPRKRRSR